MFSLHFQKGQSLVELLMALGLTAILIPALATGLVSSREGKAQQDQRLQAVSLIKEAQEATRIAREKDWVAISTNGTYHPATQSATWALVPGQETINGFTRKVVITDALRDSSGKIATISGAIDPSTKLITTTVSWGSPIASSVQSTQFFSRFSNATFTQTSQAEFNTGTKSATITTNTNGGEVALSSVGRGDWCAPGLSLTALDLPGQGITTAVSATEGHAYVTTGGNASGNSMDSIDISNPPFPSPPVATNSGSYNDKKTYGIFADTNYVYLTSDHPGLTVDIVNATTRTHAGYFSASGGADGDSVYVYNGIGYVTAGTKLYTFNASTINGSTSQAQLASITIAGRGTRVRVVNDTATNTPYAYVSIAGAATELQIISVTNNGATLSITGQADVNGQAAQDIYVNPSGSRVYMATGTSSSQREFFIIDASSKIGNRPILSSSDTNGMDPKGIIVVSGNRAIVVGNGGQQYQVFNITNESAPTICGGLTNPNGASSINAIDSITEADSDAYSYIVTNNASKEFQIIEGGAGGNSYATSGTFESSTFDATVSAAFNRFDVTFVKPSQTDIKFQVSGSDANPATSNCTGLNFIFVGPDGTGSTYFATSSAIPLSSSGSYKNPARCFRYKAFLSTTDLTQTPVLYDFTLNYSP